MTEQVSEITADLPVPEPEKLFHHNAKLADLPGNKHLFDVSFSFHITDHKTGQNIFEIQLGPNDTADTVSLTEAWAWAANRAITALENRADPEATVVPSPTHVGVLTTVYAYTSQDDEGNVVHDFYHVLDPFVLFVLAEEQPQQS